MKREVKNEIKKGKSEKDENVEMKFIHVDGRRWKFQLKFIREDQR